MEKLEKILNDIKPGVDFKKENSLIADNVLTSFDIITLVAEISNEFGVSLGIADIVPDNFQSMDAIYKMIKDKKEQ